MSIYYSDHRKRNARYGTSPLFLFIMMVLFIAHAFSQKPPAPVNWDPWKFLIGEWIGGGDGIPGQGSGGFTFTLDLQKTILVRKNYAEYPATKDRPAFRHDDLMVIYQTDDGSTRATYFDNERHIIHYDVQFSADSNSVVFLAGITPSAPRFRLIYAKMENETIGIRFDLAPPDKPDVFSQYINAKAHRKR